MKQTCTVILGSGSPRRKKLLEDWGLRFEVLASSFDESTVDPDLDPESFVKASAQGKMNALNRPKGTCLITADTIVSQNGNILGKPNSKEQAKEMLKGLLGTSHEVWSSYAISFETHQVCRALRSKVWFTQVKASWLDYYVDCGHVLDKAGAYGIQEQAGAWIDRVEGSIDTVIGLPMDSLLKDLLAMKVIVL